MTKILLNAALAGTLLVMGCNEETFSEKDLQAGTVNDAQFAQWLKDLKGLDPTKKREAIAKFQQSGQNALVYINRLVVSATPNTAETAALFEARKHVSLGIKTRALTTLEVKDDAHAEQDLLNFGQISELEQIFETQPKGSDYKKRLSKILSRMYFKEGSTRMYLQLGLDFTPRETVHRGMKKPYKTETLDTLTTLLDHADPRMGWGVSFSKTPDKERLAKYRLTPEKLADVFDAYSTPQTPAPTAPAVDAARRKLQKTKKQHAYKVFVYLTPAQGPAPFTPSTRFLKNWQRSKARLAVITFGTGPRNAHWKRLLQALGENPDTHFLNVNANQDTQSQIFTFLYNLGHEAYKVERPRGIAIGTKHTDLPPIFVKNTTTHAQKIQDKEKGEEEDKENKDTAKENP